MNDFPSTHDDYQKVGTYLMDRLLPQVSNHLKSDEYTLAARNILARIDAGEQFTLDEVTEKLRLPEFVLMLMLEIRQSDIRIANAEQKLEREALGSAQAFIEKCKATKH